MRWLFLEPYRRLELIWFWGLSIHQRSCIKTAIISLELIKTSTWLVLDISIIAFVILFLGCLSGHSAAIHAWDEAHSFGLVEICICISFPHETLIALFSAKCQVFWSVTKGGIISIKSCAQTFSIFTSQSLPSWSSCLLNCEWWLLSVTWLLQLGWFSTFQVVPGFKMLVRNSVPIIKQRRIEIHCCVVHWHQGFLKCF